MTSQIPNITILVVEDEHFMRMLILQALESIGFTSLCEAEDGKQALQVMRKKHVDFVISDIEMRPLNGLELVRQIRVGEAPIDPGSRIIFLSGLGDMSTLSAASELDVHGFMVKPFSANQLRTKMQEALRLTVRLREPSVYESLAFTPAALQVRQKSQAKGSGYSVTTKRQALRSEKSHTASQPIQPAYETCQPATAEQKQICVAVAELCAGMTLCEDVLARGVVMLNKGAILDPRLLLVLRDMRSVLDKSEYIVELPKDP
jgi:CheY-like chemotaxis protein